LLQVCELSGSTIATSGIAGVAVEFMSDSQARGFQAAINRAQKGKGSLPAVLAEELEHTTAVFADARSRAEPVRRGGCTRPYASRPLPVPTPVPPPIAQIPTARYYHDRSASRGRSASPASGAGDAGSVAAARAPSRGRDRPVSAQGQARGAPSRAPRVAALARPQQLLHQGSLRAAGRGAGSASAMQCGGVAASEAIELAELLVALTQTRQQRQAVLDSVSGTKAATDRLVSGADITRALGDNVRAKHKQALDATNRKLSEVVDARSEADFALGESMQLTDEIERLTANIAATNILCAGYLASTSRQVDAKAHEQQVSGEEQMEATRAVAALDYRFKELQAELDLLLRASA
jgi:hypothetical protein